MKRRSAARGGGGIEGEGFLEVLFEQVMGGGCDS
jgi:hypothetical protein